MYISRQAFCKKSYNIENIKFYIDVMAYRALFDSAVEYRWQSSGDIESIVEARTSTAPETNGWLPTASTASHSSNKALSAMSHSKHIWRNYLDPLAKYQVCVQGDVLERTRQRMLALDSYGPYVFDEALCDAVRSLEHFILPAFALSSLYFEMQIVLEMLRADHADMNFADAIDPPKRAIFMMQGATQIVLEDIYKSRELYISFMKFLKIRHCSENLVCKRLIDQYRSQFRGTELHNRERAKRFAVLIVKYFVLRGSMYEVSIKSSHRKRLMLGFASFSPLLFVDVDRSVTENLRSTFSEFISKEVLAPKAGMLGFANRLKNSFEKPKRNSVYAEESSEAQNHRRKSSSLSQHQTGCSRYDADNDEEEADPALDRSALSSLESSVDMYPRERRKTARRVSWTSRPSSGNARILHGEAGADNRSIAGFLMSAVALMLQPFLPKYRWVHPVG